MIKIGDFGFSEYIYEKNYFRQSGSDKSVKLPVKWMAPESLSDGVFSEKSDVVGINQHYIAVEEIKMFLNHFLQMAVYIYRYYFNLDTSEATY